MEVSMYFPRELPVHLQKLMFTMKFYMVSQLRIRLHPQNIPLSQWMGIRAHNLTCRAKRLQVCPFAWWKIAASLPGLVGIPQKEGPNWHAVRRLTGFQGLNLSEISDDSEFGVPLRVDATPWRYLGVLGKECCRYLEMILTVHIFTIIYHYLPWFTIIVSNRFQRQHLRVLNGLPDFLQGLGWSLKHPQNSHPAGGKAVTLWKMVIYNGFTHWKWWFSIAMLVYQRVVHLLLRIQNGILMMLETSPHGCCHASEPPNKLSGVVPVPLAAACSQSIVISEKLMETCIWRFHSKSQSWIQTIKLTIDGSPQDMPDPGKSSALFLSACRQQPRPSKRGLSNVENDQAICGLGLKF